MFDNDLLVSQANNKRHSPEFVPIKKAGSADGPTQRAKKALETRNEWRIFSAQEKYVSKIIRLYF